MENAGANLHPMRCGLMVRIGRMRSAHHKASADELLIGFLPILLKFCNGPLSLPIPPGRANRQVCRGPATPRTEIPLRFLAERRPGPGPTGKKKGVEREMDGWQGPSSVGNLTPTPSQNREISIGQRA